MTEKTEVGHTEEPQIPEYVASRWYVNLHGASPTEPKRLDIGPLGMSMGLFQIHPHQLLTQEQMELVARRLVASWNACAGLSTAALEGGVVAEFVGLLDLACSDLIQRLHSEAGAWTQDVHRIAEFADNHPLVKSIRAALAKTRAKGEGE